MSSASDLFNNRISNNARPVSLTDRIAQLEIELRPRPPRQQSASRQPLPDRVTTPPDYRSFTGIEQVIARGGNLRDLPVKMFSFQPDSLMSTDTLSPEDTLGVARFMTNYGRPAELMNTLNLGEEYVFPERQDALSEPIQRHSL